MRPNLDCFFAESNAILTFHLSARGCVGIFRRGWIDMAETVLRGAGLNLCRGRAGCCGVVALGPDGSTACWKSLQDVDRPVDLPAGLSPADLWMTWNQPFWFRRFIGAR